MMKMLKNEKGFTLMEAIISIAALAVISGFILQMFILSSQVNIKAREVDTGNNLAFSCIELFKKQKAAGDYTQEPFFEDCLVELRKDGFAIRKAFDKDFNQVVIRDMSGIEAINGMYADEGAGAGQERVSFLLTVEVVRGEEHGSGSLPEAAGGEGVRTGYAGRLDKIRVTVSRVGEQPGALEIVEVSASKYFSYRGF